MSTKNKAEELRETQKKIQAIRLGRQPLSEAKIAKLEKLIDLEQELYEELGPDWLEAEQESSLARNIDYNDRFGDEG